MHLNRLELTDFRCYRHADLRLEPGVTAFTGANGQGKTNLVEAVGYVATLGSHRVATDAPLVRSGADRAVVRAGVSAAERSLLVEIEINPSRANRARLNRAPLRRPRQVLGALRAVLFAPEDLALVKGDPGERRRYLDDLLVQSAPRFAGVRADYDRVVRQRTALLKAARARPPGQRPMLASLDAWDDQLVRTGAELMAARLELAGTLRPLTVKAYAAVSGEESAVEAVYRAAHLRRAGPDRAGQDEDELMKGDGEADGAAQLAASLREALTAARAAEIERGVCLVGPHRDELELRIGDLPARGYASHGEAWSLALALRLAGYELLRGASPHGASPHGASGDGASGDGASGDGASGEGASVDGASVDGASGEGADRAAAGGQSGGDPVLLLDDVFAELDEQRRERLATLAAAAEQVLVTASVPADLPAVLRPARFEVAGGMVTRAG